MRGDAASVTRSPHRKGGDGGVRHAKKASKSSRLRRETLRYPEAQPSIDAGKEEVGCASTMHERQRYMNRPVRCGPGHEGRLKHRNGCIRDPSKHCKQNAPARRKKFVPICICARRIWLLVEAGPCRSACLPWPWVVPHESSAPPPWAGKHEVHYKVGHAGCCFSRHPPSGGHAMGRVVAQLQGAFPAWLGIDPVLAISGLRREVLWIRTGYARRRTALVR